MISKSDASGTTTYTFNEENQLTQVTLPGNLTVNYKYDGLGRRIQRTTSAGADERYVYDGHDALIDLNADWSVATTYFNDLGIDSHLRQTSATTGVSYFLADHLGSTDALTDLSGNVIEQLAYDSFGNSTGSVRTRYGYTGRERDPDTGQLYYRARFYDPQVGRFISEDPIGFEGGWNFYAYVGNNPTNWRDPLGLKQCKKKCGIKKAPYYGIDFGTGIIWGQSTLPGGQRFFWRAEFLNDATHDPKCCEVRQLISWNEFGPNTVPHRGFPSWVKPNTWIEDRDKDGLRYGRRSGPHDLANRYHGNEYFGSDRPMGFPQGTTLSFRLIVVDVCRGGKIIYRSKTLTVNF